MSLLDNDCDVVINDVVVEGEKQKIKWFMRNYCNMTEMGEPQTYEPNWMVVFDNKANYTVARFYKIVNVSGELYIKILKQDATINNYQQINPRTQFVLKGYPNKKLPFYIRFIDEKRYRVDMLMINCNSTPEEIEVPFVAKVL